MELPGQLVVFDPETNQHRAYTPEGFVPVTGFTDEVDLSYDPSRSPDGQWTISFDQTLSRFVVANESERIPFKHYCMSLSEVAWSPDSAYVAYRADSDDGSWTSRIMLLNLRDGSVTQIGEGDAPRWYPTRS